LEPLQQPSKLLQRSLESFQHSRWNLSNARRSLSNSRWSPFNARWRDLGEGVPLSLQDTRYCLLRQTSRVKRSRLTHPAMRRVSCFFLRLDRRLRPCHCHWHRRRTAWPLRRAVAGWPLLAKLVRRGLAVFCRFWQDGEQPPLRGPLDAGRADVIALTGRQADCPLDFAGYTG
jgi:hypothetical protein